MCLHNLQYVPERSRSKVAEMEFLKTSCRNCLLMNELDVSSEMELAQTSASYLNSLSFT